MTKSKSMTIAIAIAIAITSLLLPNIHAQSTDTIKPIEPPFGLNWGEDQKNIIKWAANNKFPTTKGKTKKGRDAIEIEGPFPEAEFNRLRFYFNNNQLNEIELQFNKIGPPNDKNQQFEMYSKALAIKDQMDQQFGKGQLVKNGNGEKDGGAWKFIQQIWTDEEHSIWLAVFNANHPKSGTLSMTSLHYRWETKINGKKIDKVVKK